MKFGRNLQGIVTVIVACSLFVVSLAEWKNSGFGAGDYTPFVLVCCVVGAVGVIWLGWYWLKLAGGITSIARLLKQEQPCSGRLRPDEPVHIGPSSNAARHGGACRSWVINELSEALVKRLDSDANHKLALEKQIKDLQIQIQLTQRRGRNTEAIIYGIRDAVIVIDEFDKLLMANESAGKIFNFDFKSSQHRPISEVIAPASDKQGKFVDFLRQSRRSKSKAIRREMEFLADGKPKTFDCIVSCVYDDRKQVCGVVAVLHDITREKQIQQMKNDFVSHVSHELKAPLASISAYSEMLVDGEADDEQTRKEFYSVIQNQAKRLNRLIEDILNVSRIESGLIKVEKRPVSLTILIEEQLQMIKSTANEKNIEIIGQKPIVFDQVYADKDMISQVIVNLLSNAIKYTPSGGSVKVETAVDEIAGTAQVSVTDTGVGIPENEIEHIFDKFYRVGANESCAKGTGLGLNLVKQIIEKVHNGRMFVSSKPGVGSTFGFELPLATEKCEV